MTKVVGYVYLVCHVRGLLHIHQLGIFVYMYPPYNMPKGYNQIEFNTSVNQWTICPNELTAKLQEVLK